MWGVLLLNICPDHKISTLWREEKKRIVLFDTSLQMDSFQTISITVFCYEITEQTLLKDAGYKSCSQNGIQSARNLISVSEFKNSVTGKDWWRPKKFQKFASFNVVPCSFWKMYVYAVLLGTPGIHISPGKLMDLFSRLKNNSYWVCCILNRMLHSAAFFAIFF